MNLKARFGSLQNHEINFVNSTSSSYVSWSSRCHLLDPFAKLYKAKVLSSNLI